MDFGRITLLVYALLMVVGGVMGYANKKSVVSLVAGLASALVLLIAFKTAENNPKGGLAFGAFLAFLMTGNFVSRYMKTHHFMPNGLFGIVSVVALLCLVAATLQAKS